MFKLVDISILVIAFFLAIGTTNSGFNMKESTVFFSSDSYLRIKGKSNVNKFECGFDMQVLSDSIRVNYNDYNEYVEFKNAAIVLPNWEFDCGGKMINKDFHKLLNSSEFPKITLVLKQVIHNNSDDASISATVDIMICNIVNTYTIPINIANTDELKIDGVLPLDINDFNLTAPSKALGMIKVSSEIEIEFSLKIVKC